jgi:hypothetical protein
LVDSTFLDLQGGAEVVHEAPTRVAASLFGVRPAAKAGSSRVTLGLVQGGLLAKSIWLIYM